MHHQTEQRETRLLELVPGAAGVRGRRGRRGRGERAALPEPRRDADRRGRPVDEPVDRRHPRCDRGDARARGGRAPEQLERDPQRRAGGRARGEAGAGRPDALDPGRDRGDGRLRRRRGAPRTNAAEMEEAIAAVATGAVTIASRDVELDGLAVEKGDCLGARRRRPDRRRRRLRGGRAALVVERLLAEPRGVLTILTGEDAPALNGLLGPDRGGAPGPRGRGPGRRPAALPPAALRRVRSTGADPGRPDRGQRRLPRGARAAARRCAATSRSSPRRRTATASSSSAASSRRT